jgi:hypothetical protein
MDNEFQDDTLPIPGLEPEAHIFVGVDLALAPDGPGLEDDLREVKQKTVSGNSIMMHMPGSKMFEDFKCIDTIDAREFKPKSDTYTVLTHNELVGEVMYAIDRYLTPNGINITDQVCVLGKGKTVDGPPKLGARLFGLLGLSLRHDEGADDAVQCVVGIQNALDGSGKAQVCVGNRVFICDNMAFSGDLMVSHRHSKNIAKTMYGAVHGIIRDTIDRFRKDVELRDLLKKHEVGLDEGFRILAELAALDAFDNMKQFNNAVKQYRWPQYGVFANDSSLWGVYNAATWGVKSNCSPLGVIESTNVITTKFREIVGVGETVEA